MDYLIICIIKIYKFDNKYLEYISLCYWLLNMYRLIVRDVILFLGINNLSFFYKILRMEKKYLRFFFLI